MPASYVRPRLEAIERCWGDHGKDAMNSLFGLMSKTEQKRYYLTCSTEPQDAMGETAPIVRKSPGSDLLKDYIFTQRVLTFASWRPVHQKCLERERLMMARAVRIITRVVRPERIISFHVDSVYFKSDSPALKEALEAERYADGTEGLSLRRARPREGRQANAGAAPRDLAASAGSTSAARNPEWRTVDPFEALERGESFVCDAPPGFGKIGAHQAAAPEGPRCDGHRPDSCRSTEARRGHDCATPSSISMCCSSPSRERFSSMSTACCLPISCAALEHLQGCRIVLFGDYLQLPPVYNAWRGQPSKRLHESRLMGLWADWNRVELNVYYRSRRQPVVRGLVQSGTPRGPRALCSRRSREIPQDRQHARLGPLHLK
jgi:hypothetical protein